MIEERLVGPEVSYHVVSDGERRRVTPQHHFASRAEMKRRIAAGEIGKLRHIESNFSGPPSYQIEPGNWRSNRVESPGGSMTARGCHVLDAMVHLAGLATEVVAVSVRQQLDIDVDDTTSCLLRFAGGATGSLATLHAATRFYRLHAFGSKGALELRGDTELDLSDLEGNVRRLSFEAIDKERAELEAFADAVAGKVKFVIAPEEIVTRPATDYVAEFTREVPRAAHTSACARISAPVAPTR